MFVTSWVIITASAAAPGFLFRPRVVILLSDRRLTYVRMRAHMVLCDIPIVCVCVCERERERENEKMVTSKKDVFISSSRLSLFFLCTYSIRSHLNLVLRKGIFQFKETLAGCCWF